MKYLLIEVVERDISAPEFFDTYTEAYDRMCEYVAQVCDVSVDDLRYGLSELGDFDDNVCVRKNCAWATRYGTNFDWKIFEV